MLIGLAGGQIVWTFWEAEKEAQASFGLILQMFVCLFVEENPITPEVEKVVQPENIWAKSRSYFSILACQRNVYDKA